MYSEWDKIFEEYDDSNYEIRLTEEESMYVQDDIEDFLNIVKQIVIKEILLNNELNELLACLVKTWKLYKITEFEDNDAVRALFKIMFKTFWKIKVIKPQIIKVN